MKLSESRAFDSVDAFNALTSPELLTHFQVKTHPTLPVLLNAGERPHDEYDGDTDIMAVGVGPLGTRMVQLLSRNLPGVTCHEIFPSDQQKSSDDIAVLLSSIRTSHLVFVLTGFDDEYCESMAQAVGRAACEAGVLTVVVTPYSTDRNTTQCSDGRRWCDAAFGVSDRSLPEQQGAVVLNPETLTGYSMRHMVAVITNLIAHRTGICIDFNDAVTLMRGGSLGRMGVGIASDPARGATAAERAIERLERQGIDISSATGALASLHGSSQLTMEDFDAACKVIHGQTTADANIIVGLISDEQMGSNVKVTILAVHQC